MVCKLKLFTIVQKGWEDSLFPAEEWQWERLETLNLSIQIYTYIYGCLPYFFACDGHSGPVSLE